ncbi:MAG: site-2 protease family protein [Patescibacteria group bacterium]|nr:site-2 protease family protein [Patescibacteria group bacterium]MDD4610527.1 site-2 protease family protein [Patescibacteria group bacterium]
MLQIFQIIVLIFSAIIHEYMHGWMADRLGDPTAKEEGRLTLNPIPHIDWFGSIFLPLVLIFSSSPFILGWAKPVPYNPYNLSDQKYGPAKVALAGPLANFAVALLFGLLLRFFSAQLMLINPMLITLLVSIVFINLLLMVFNLIPIPPLDGSKIISAILPYNLRLKLENLERFGMIFVLLFVMFGFAVISPIIQYLFIAITGID